MFKDATPEEIDSVLQESWKAFQVYKEMPLKIRADFMRSIARELEALGDQLIQTAMLETHLPEARLRGERARTIFQLNSYADFAESGQWLDARIDTAIPGKTPPKPDIRKMLIPLGPVVVFGASNFPLAYSTAGGDTACAFAAGCPVVVKAHPAHAKTSELVASAIKKAVADSTLPQGIFAHIHGASSAVGEALVKNEYTKAVGFTGSYSGGKQLFDWGNQRKTPIPVFAEMGSVNPVFLLPCKLSSSYAEIANMLSVSITLGVGQFCTKPGIIIGIDGEDLRAFTHDFGKAITQIAPAHMLHSGIAKSFEEKKAVALLQEEVHLVSESSTLVDENEGLPTVATTSGKAFLDNPLLHEEVFGPYAIVVHCSDQMEVNEVAEKLEGQLTATIMATEEDLANNKDLICSIKNICGRFIINGVPTGVEVCLSMQHGGPFPATTDSRFTSVGADGIKRFARPISFQNWPDGSLPDELKNNNPLNIWRTVDNIPGHK